MIEIKTDKNNNAVVLTLNGELSIESVKEFNRSMDINIAEKPDIIALNCENLKHVDSYSISHIFNYSKVTRSKNIKFLVFNLNRFLKKVFDITDLSSFVEVIDSEEFLSRYKTGT